MIAVVYQVVGVRQILEHVSESERRSKELGCGLGLSQCPRRSYATEAGNREATLVTRELLEIRDTDSE